MESLFTQAGRYLRVTTPLGADALLLVGVRGREAVSSLFDFDLDLLAVDNVPFDRLLGQPATVTLDPTSPNPRFVSGIVSRLTRGRPFAAFRSFRATLSPQLWLLTRTTQTRVFQGQSVPDILQAVFTGLTVSFQLSGTYLPRDYCVQYQESDFAFASRLMEEEGIFYFFSHTAETHTLIVADTSSQAPKLTPATLRFDVTEAGGKLGDRVTAWETTQEVRAGKVTLWDYAFQTPAHDPGASAQPADSVNVGSQPHPLRFGVNADLEVYEDGGYVKQFDDTSPTGGPQSDFSHIFTDNARVAKLRSEEQAAQSLVSRGDSHCTALTPGYQFTLAGHVDANGANFVTSVEHEATLAGDYRSGGTVTGVEYGNAFDCIPLTLPFRPARTTPRPQVRGVETATVVGPQGQAVFCDRYGRVKVRFHWDRRTSSNDNNSCWVRVSQPLAGQGFGMIHLPRIGQEVVVGFRQGDPDRPVILGSVYNGEQMPPFPLPENATQSGIKSSTMGSSDAQAFSGLGIEDKPGQEHVHLHSERHLTQSAEHTLFVNAAQAHSVNVGTVAVRQVGSVTASDHSTTTGAPATVGSGSGTGGVSGLSGPFAWNPATEGGIAADLDLVLGWRQTNTGGFANSWAFGQANASNINPLALAAIVAGVDGPMNIDKPAGPVDAWPKSSQSKATLWPFLINAQTTVNIGGQTNIQYGPNLNIHRGFSLALNTFGSPPPIQRALAVLYSAAVAFDMVVPGIVQAVAGQSLTPAEVAGEAGALWFLLNRILGLWTSVEGEAAMIDVLEAQVAAAKAEADALALNDSVAKFTGQIAAFNATVGTLNAQVAALEASAAAAAKPQGKESSNLDKWIKANNAAMEMSQVPHWVFSPHLKLVASLPMNAKNEKSVRPTLKLQAIGGRVQEGDYFPGIVEVLSTDFLLVDAGGRAALALLSESTDPDGPTSGTSFLQAHGPKGQLALVTNFNPLDMTQNDQTWSNLLMMTSMGVAVASTSGFGVQVPISEGTSKPSVIDMTPTTILVNGQQINLGTSGAVVLVIGNGENGTSVTIQSPAGNVTVDANGVSVASTGTLTLKGDQGVTIDAGTGAVQVTCANFTVNATGSISLGQG